MGLVCYKRTKKEYVSSKGHWALSNLILGEVIKHLSKLIFVTRWLVSIIICLICIRRKHFMNRRRVSVGYHWCYRMHEKNISPSVFEILTLMKSTKWLTMYVPCKHKLRNIVTVALCIYWVLLHSTCINLMHLLGPRFLMNYWIEIYWSLRTAKFI